MPPPTALDVPPDMKDELVCLAVPLARAGVTEVDFGDSRRRGTAPLARHRRRAARPHPCQRRSRTGADRRHPICACCAHATPARPTRCSASRMCSSAAATARWCWIAATSRRRCASMRPGSCRPPRRCCTAWCNSARRALAARMGQLGHGVSELADFLMLQTAQPQRAGVAPVRAGAPRASARVSPDLPAAGRRTGDLWRRAPPRRRIPAVPARRPARRASRR